MTMQRDVVSKEMAKRLKEAGWEQDSAWGYRPPNGLEHEPLEFGELPTSQIRGQPSGWWARACFAAPTIGDLLGVLPLSVEIRKCSGGYEASLEEILRLEGESMPVVGKAIITVNPNPADALAALWVALKEKKLL